MAQGHPLDQLMCDLRDLTAALQSLVAAQSGGEGASSFAPGSTAQRQLSAQPAGRLVSGNQRRGGLIVVNATDGSLLLSLGEEDTDLTNYFYVLGPGETWDTRAAATPKNLRGAISYAWVTENTDLSSYPPGVFAAASGGALKVTELTSS